MAGKEAHECASFFFYVTRYTERPMIIISVPSLAFFGGSMSGGEILLILLAMLLLFGSKKLPSMARNLGKSLETFRRASRDVTDEIMRADLDDDKPVAKNKAADPASSGTSTNVDTPDIAVKPAGHSIGRHDDRPS